MKRRQLYYGLALLATLLAVWWASAQEDADAPPAAPRATRQAAARTALQAATGKRNDGASQASLLAQLRAEATPAKLPALQQELFAAASFEPPPPKVAAPKPSAPPLRFKFMGRVTEGDRPAVFLDDNGNMLIAHVGDTIAGQYRVVSIGESNMQFEYTPLNTAQTLNFR